MPGFDFSLFSFSLLNRTMSSLARPKRPARPQQPRRVVVTVPSARSRRSRPRSRAAISPSSAFNRNQVSAYSKQTVSAPVSLSTGRRMDRRRGKKSDRFPGCDFIGNVSDVNGAMAFVKYAINPGNPVTFPWLSIEAKQWNEYTFHALSFKFVSRTATSQVGNVVLAPNYDASDPVPTLENQATNFADATEDNEWKDITCVLDPASMHPIGPRKYVRIAAVAGDIKTYDVGNMFVGVEGATTNTIGKLYVEYDVEFFDRIVVPSAAASAATSFFNITGQTLTSTVRANLAFSAGANPLGATVSSTGAGDAILLPAGSYLVTIILNVADSVGEVFTSLLQTYSSPANLLAATSIISNSPNGTVENSQLVQQFNFIADGVVTLLPELTLTGATGTLTVSAGSAGGSIVVSVA
jgi:hypothetical protein